ncbi:MAG: sarcosine oxidase subunit delta [Hyphomonadaceae bacterium]|nr:sarcosine oxidase subunit delta [Hyphomonadaceae bacterium]
MLLIHCPHCNEERPELEFAYAGEAHIVRPNEAEQAEMSDADWSKFMFIRDNIRGDHAERWWHAHGCNMFFNAIRNTVTDKFTMTYKVCQKRPTEHQIKVAKND